MPAVQETVEQVRRIDVDQYKYGFETLIESEKAPKGLSEDTVRFISAKKNEPDWMLAGRRRSGRRQRLWPGRGGRCVRFGLGRHHVPGGIGQSWRLVHADFGSGA